MKACLRAALLALTLSLALAATASAHSAEAVSTPPPPPSDPVIVHSGCTDVCNLPTVELNYKNWLAEMRPYLASTLPNWALVQADNVAVPSSRPDTTFSFSLSGGANLPSPGDPNGSGTGTVSVYPSRNTLCWSLNASGVGQGVELHLHRGTRNEQSVVVSTVSLMTDALRTPGSISGCLYVTRRSILNEIQARPHMFYMALHNTEFPGGALRGQLSTATPPTRGAVGGCNFVCTDGGSGSTPVN
ncbi:MAG TPA: CHRD domain-containing protein [Solirubrobacteraceae bacterium]|jgi:hypothetical protein